jgi:prepilin-type N-terminal cleavage/methylation domain-containing protein
MLISTPRGFSLFEILVVIVIIGMSTLFVSISVTNNGQRKVFNEAVRLRTIIETVADRAAIFQRPMIISIQPHGYEVKERIQGNWILLKEGFLSPYRIEEQVRTSSKNNEILINGMGFTNRGEILFFSTYKNKNGSYKSVVLFDELGRVNIH